jgi:type I pantothenate kinase
MRLRSLDDPVNLDEVRRIYLSMSRLLYAHVEASQSLFEQRKNFLNVDEAIKTPFIIGIAGSVAVGKSTTARILKELLARWESHPKVDLVTTDGFLLPNAVLREQGLMERKGFPESYDVAAVLRFLSQLKAGEHSVRAPLYSHLTYDVLPGEYVTIDRPDILIFEGINVLQVRDLPEDGKMVPFRLGLFRFLDLYRRRRGTDPRLVCDPFHAAAPNRVPRSEIVLSPLFGTVRRCRALASPRGFGRIST